MTRQTFATVLAVTASLSAAAALAAEVTVLDGEGQPVADVAVRCTRGVTAVVLTDAHGRGTLPESCREVQCMRGGWIPGKAEIVDGAVSCRLGAGLKVRGRVEVPGVTDCLSVALVASPAGPVAQSTMACPSESGSVRIFQLEAVPPGAYDLTVLRAGDFWTCTTRLGALEAGEREVVAGWREPVEVHGTVLDSDARPFPRVLLKVSYESEEDAGAMRCAMHVQALDVVSGDDGGFRALVDPARSWSLVVDPAWRPATVRIDGDVRGRPPARPPTPA